MTSSKSSHISLDTSAARNIQTIDFISSFLQLVERKRWTIVTTSLIEEEMKKQEIHLLEELEKNEFLNRHSMADFDENKIRAEDAFYKTLKPRVKEADAQLLAATIVHGYGIITDDFSSLIVLKECCPYVFPKLRTNSTVHVICNAEHEHIIPFEDASSYYENYKCLCFSNPDRIPKKLKMCNYLTLKREYTSKLL